MARTRTTYRCLNCEVAMPRWVGRCPTCDSWNTLVEEEPKLRPRLEQRPVALVSIDPASAPARGTGIGELDRVLGGGLLPGSVTLLGGEPGVGKSTLLLQALVAMSGRGATCLLVSAEESAAQVRARAQRLGTLPPTLLVHAETDLQQVLAAIETIGPDVCVIDSIQTVYDPDVSGSAGSVTQVTECAQALSRVAKDRGMCCLLVGHVTKEGELAGPRLLEHLVDTVLSFEGDRHHALRLVRAIKHRFGPTGELGLFEMHDCGLREVPDASGVLLTDRRCGVPGSIVVPAIEGRRPILVEVQALVARSALTLPRRSAHGLDAGRLALILAVLSRRQGVVLSNKDVYASVVGGVRVVEPAADLAIALALVSADFDVALPSGLVAFGELGLAGELRQVPHTKARLVEAARLGFTRAVIPLIPDEVPAAIEPVRVSTLREAVAAIVSG
jgi:DNA repair protein RadA/Sms